jgi:replicative DNA helicase
MIELIIIKYILNNNIYNKYINNIIITNKELVKLLYCVKSLQESSDKEQYSIDDLELKFFSDYPFLKDAEKEIFNAIFDKLRTLEVDDTRIEEYLEKQRSAVMAREVAEMALEVTEGRKDFNEILDKISKMDIDKPLEEEITFVTDDLEELYESQVTTKGLRWRLNCLNQSLGSLRQGDFGFLFARPETGKTTFLASEVTHMATQAEGNVLWFNNEEQGSKVMMRCIQASLGLSLPELYRDIKGNKEKFINITQHKIKIFDQASISYKDVNKICEQIKPSLIIFDQIDKIKGFEEDRNDLMLGSIYQWARELAKDYAPVIAVCQADGTGEGVKWLNMGNVANAKTSKQAEADWILGIGKTNDEGLEYMRHMCISKNKLVGDSDSIPDMRHGKFDCVIKPDIARYVDV